MSDKSNCYEILGLTAGVSSAELKAAYRDLIKVWHPDRFAHDPHLQSKAQEKLKEINEAYEWLTSARVNRRRTTPRGNRKRPEPDYPRRDRNRPGGAVMQPTRWALMLVAILIFGLVFFFTSRSLIRRTEEQTRGSSWAEQIPAVEIHENQQSSADAGTGQKESSRRNSRNSDSGDSQNPIRRQVVEPDARVPEPMTTTTVSIDQITGMLARPECPTKIAMTYPTGSEPHQYCNVHITFEPMRAEPKPTKGSRIKSLTKRLISPSKW